jgi:hypothetical protein
MAHLPDMSEYNYFAWFVRPGTKAVGWLDEGHPFPVAPPDEGFLNSLWEFC